VSGASKHSKSLDLRVLKTVDLLCDGDRKPSECTAARMGVPAGGKVTVTDRVEMWRDQRARFRQRALEVFRQADGEAGVGERAEEGGGRGRRGQMDEGADQGECRG
jgi:hypothetical protein